MILCCGEALIDMLPRITTEGEAAFAPYVGGAVFNSAIALGRLGAPAGFFSGLSSDLFGGQFRDALGASKVSSTYAHTSPRPTTLAFVRLTNGQATYTFYDENTAGRMLTIEDLPKLGAEIEAMLFGAISLISEPAGSAYEEFMRREHESRVMMLDPNIRPNFIPDKAKHLRRIREMMAMADIVKLSDEDLKWFDEAGSHEDVVRNWLDRGPKLIVVTHGSEGAVGYSKAHKVTVMPQKVKVVDTVGAGDTFNAGILASLHEQGLLTKAAIGYLPEDAIRKALELGARAAAVTVSRAGANPPWRHEIA
ncbi:carbohydrate kinase [Mesorhizobium sp. M2D.F.Ca.ET.185.01.1.1]|uniref:carbohydrate kinase family protein n=1 Tax=unclassified Mesorhizobium TaxID=325217 RepID=UPI000FCA22B7|nr:MULTISPECIES: carbohydrate kinase [unclassified Mesorhizobium]TGP76258.1 carbohydrate kinase [bacterium M00.F.Ca.ET.227.01.1.1]TGP92311.1 carbohydrate kinase [bacterium M00.F.Ca.ET.222.01.1.1]TGP96865.1 carbohydrate kinase [bacterium M00.F.Ca.ET.221.01.1.1]TGU06673.1 carbohydrate kinase [bacterium M00.F.Ca.ET.163.01.1.1]TGU27698.1 carbohydrate kinase [bacterium M00.F.Ca.ET.156.01.1.1]TGU50077.1 carbohydrate kinase [bacterium M00.F.Ca.ET.146.01.1.1]TGV68034.1 carbohydrate kinase [Mesorhizo